MTDKFFALFAKPFAFFAVKILLLILFVTIFNNSILYSQSTTFNLSCTVTGPDSLFFDKVNFNQYINGTFPINVTLTNNGSTSVDSVFVFVRSNQRFNIVPPPSKFVAASLKQNDSVKTQFLLTINPKQISGYDTVTISVTGKGGARTDCQWLIWVEKEYKPLNTIICPRDSSIRAMFVDSLNDYQPNPITVPITIINNGDAPSKETRIIYVATPGVAPADGQDPIYEVGTLAQNGGQIARSFRLKIVRRTTDTTVDLNFRVQGKGGLGDRIIDTLCTYRLFIPAARDVEFQLECKNSIQIKFENGKYSPNPFEWKTIVRNLGNATAQHVQVTIAIPPSMQLDSGSTSKLDLGNMLSGEERIVRWILKAQQIPFPDTSAICVYVFDAFNRNAQCCDTIILPAVTEAKLSSNCLIIPDSIFVDPQTGEYTPSDFLAHLQITNSGNDASDSVWAEIILTDPGLTLLNPTQPQQLVITKLDTLATADVQWKIGLIPTLNERNAAILFRVTDSKGHQTTASCTVYIAAALQSALACSAKIIPDDTLHYSFGEPGNLSTIHYDSLVYTAVCKNIGMLGAKNVQASILLPSHVALANGENAVKYFSLPVLAKDSTWNVSWRLQPEKQKDGVLDSIRVEFRTGSIRTECEDWIFVVGIPPITVLSMPRNLLERHGNTIRVPVQIDDVRDKNIKLLNIIVYYDAVKLEYDGYDLKGSLLTNTPIIDSSMKGKIYFTVGYIIPSLQNSGDLLYLNFKVLYGDGVDRLNITNTTFHFDSVSCSVNRGSILARFYDGLVTLSGECIYPMNATDKYVILQARPNPFTTSTVIEYAVPQSGHVLLSIYDVLGRKVNTLIDRTLDKGIYSVSFDASLYRSGIYFCVMESGGNRTTGKLYVEKR